MFSTRINCKIKKLGIFGFPFFPDSSCVYFHFSRNFVRLCGFQNQSRPPLPFPGALWRHPRPFGAATQPQWISGLISRREVLEWGTRLGALPLWVPSTFWSVFHRIYFLPVVRSPFWPNSKVTTQSKKQMQLLLSYISHDTTLNLLIILGSHRSFVKLIINLFCNQINGMKITFPKIAWGVCEIKSG